MKDVLWLPKQMHDHITIYVAKCSSDCKIDISRKMLLKMAFAHLWPLPIYDLCPKMTKVTFCGILIFIQIWFLSHISWKS